MRLVLELDLEKFRLTNGKYDTDCMAKCLTCAVEYAEGEGFTPELKDGVMSHAPHPVAGTFRVEAD
jgi:hypothetical protein